MRVEDLPDNVTRLADVRNRRQKLKELSDAKLEELRVEGLAELAALVERFNKDFAVVNEGGKVWAIRWRWDPGMKRDMLERISYRDFLLMFDNQKLTIVGKDQRTGNPTEVTKSHAQWWWESQNRKQFLGGVTFDPVGQPPEGYLNLWRGFKVEPKKGDWSLMRGHILKALCSNNQEHCDYVLGWMARATQCPNKQGEVALVFRGLKGCGKGIYGRWFVSLFGQHGMQIFSPNQLIGRFNDHLRDCIALFADEAFFAGDKQHEGTLKGLITEPYLTVEGKYLRLAPAPNMLHLIIASNSEWVIPASHDERRYAVWDVPDTFVGNLTYFNAITKQMENGGLAAMLYDLQNLDIQNFNFRAVPQTEGLQTQKRLSLDTLDRYLLDVLERGYVWRSKHGVAEFRAWTEFCATRLLYASYLQWCVDNRITRPENNVALGRRMTAIYSHRRPRETHIVGELETWPQNMMPDCLVIRDHHVPGYVVGSLEEARARFADVRGVEGDWRTEIG
jgi:hypothetical protein